ncbi:MAG: acyltransferase, partial [Lachnospiraceae bacterium]|nr:acyltransferase [Lachnospiraceae bacterium]
MTNDLSGPRKQFLDVLRVLATCAVVLMHVLTGATDVTDASIVPEYRSLLLSVMDLVTWCVPIFLLISGYLFLNPERTLTYPVMIKKYCRRIALAILLFGVPYAASELVVAERTFRIRMIPEALKMTLMGHTWSHMWYLYLILFLYLITPLLKKVLRVLPVRGVVTMMAVIFLGSSVAPFLNKVLDVNSIPVLPDGGVYFLYYLCGYFFAVREVCVDKGRNAGGQMVESGSGRRAGENTEWCGETQNVESRAWNVWLTAAVAVLALGMILSRTLAGFSIQMAYNYPFTVLLAVLLFAAGWNGGGDSAALAAREKDRIHRIPWQEAGALSFAVYLVHPVYVNLLYKFVKITPFTVLEQCGVQSVAAGQAVLILLLAAFCLVVLALATATAWVLRKIPVLRK